MFGLATFFTTDEKYGRHGLDWYIICDTNQTRVKTTKSIQITAMTFRRPSRMSRSLLLSSKLFSFTKGMLRAKEPDLVTRDVLAAEDASRVRSRAEQDGSACCNHEESILAYWTPSLMTPLISTPCCRRVRSCNVRSCLSNGLCNPVKSQMHLLSAPIKSFLAGLQPP